MYPIKFKNIYFNKIWGGRDFESFRDNLPDGDIGESWDISCHDNGMSFVENGYLKEKSLKDIINTYGEILLGNKVPKDKFPLLIKLINSKEKLSIQVHPNDEYAKKFEGDCGKTEIWYIVDAKPNAKLIVGTKNCDRSIFERAIKENSVEEYLNEINVKKGDCYLINSGLVHAICEGIVIAEIQQSCDITYRIYDYGRPRELHVSKALDVINFNLEVDNLSKGKVEVYDGFSKLMLCSSNYFELEKITVINKWDDISNSDKFYMLTVVDGEGLIKSNDFSEIIKKGDSLLIPATLGKYSIEGKIQILKTSPVV